MHLRYDGIYTGFAGSILIFPYHVDFPIQSKCFKGELSCGPIAISERCQKKDASNMEFFVFHPKGELERLASTVSTCFFVISLFQPPTLVGCKLGKLRYDQQQVEGGFKHLLPTKKHIAELAKC